MADLTYTLHTLNRLRLAAFNRLVNILFSFDCLVWTVITNLFAKDPGYPFESFSSAAYRAEKMGIFYGRARPVIDWIFSLLGQREHCKAVYETARNNLPEDQR